MKILVTLILAIAVLVWWLEYSADQPVPLRGEKVIVPELDTSLPTPALPATQSLDLSLPADSFSGADVTPSADNVLPNFFAEQQDNTRIGVSGRLHVDEQDAERVEGAEIEINISR